MVILDEFFCPDHQKAVCDAKPDHAREQFSVKTLDELTLVI